MVVEARGEAQGVADLGGVPPEAEGIPIPNGRRGDAHLGHPPRPGRALHDLSHPYRATIVATASSTTWAAASSDRA